MVRQRVLLKPYSVFRFFRKEQTPESGKWSPSTTGINCALDIGSLILQLRPPMGIIILVREMRLLRFCVVSPVSPAPTKISPL